MKNQKLNTIVKLSVVAALYVVFTMILYPISFGQIQLRLSELLMVLVFFNKKYTISLTLGCLISNLLSGVMLDVLFGTLATLLACLAMVFIKNKYISLLFTPFFNGLLLGIEFLILYEDLFYLTFIYIFISEFIIVYILGIVFIKVVDKLPKFKDLIANV